MSDGADATAAAEEKLAEAAPRKDSAAEPDLLARARELLPRIDELFASIVLAVVLVASYRRLAYGADPTDEAFALAITQRFSLGDRPYIDEFNLRQTAGLLTAPIYWAYLKISGSSTNGIVYFMRLVYLAVQCLVGWSVFTFAVRRVPRSFALVAAAMPITFVPFGMPVANYNGLGAMLLTLGIFTALRALLDETTRGAMILAGVCGGLGCIAYPPIAIPVTMIGAATLVLPDTSGGTRPRWRRTLDFAIGIAIVGIPFMIVLAPGLPGLKNALEYEGMTTSARSVDKLKGVIAAVNRLSPASPSTLTTLGVAGLIAGRAMALRKAVFAFIILFMAYYWSVILWDARAQVGQNILTLHLSLYLGLLAGFFLVFVERGKVMHTLVLAGWLPSVVAGLMMAMSSDNGCMNGGLGLFAASVLAMVVAPMAIERKDAPLGPVQRLIAVGVMATLPLAAISVNAATTYNDGPITPNMPRVTIGPFRGLYGTPQRVARIEELTRELRTMVRPGDVMLSYYDFPGAYLIVPSRPGLQTVWTDRRAKLGPMLPYYGPRRTGHGIVLVITGSSGVSPELEALVEQPDRLLKDRGWFKVYREPPPP
jgi:hypothetical protein